MPGEWKLQGLKKTAEALKRRRRTLLPEIQTDDLIKIVNLCKVYDTGAVKVVGLKNVNLTIKKGEFVAIMGQSGSGKSTLMNILGCLDRPVIGHYYLDGIDIAALNQDQLSMIRNQKIGFVFQSFNLISRTSALKNVELPMTYAHRSKKERVKRAAELLGRVGLGERTDHMPNEMSGGQRQRVAIARALANEPPLILADEPTGNLDTASSIEIMELFSQLHDEGATVVVVTHEENIAEFTDRIIRFRDGRIISDHRNPHKIRKEEAKAELEAGMKGMKELTAEEIPELFEDEGEEEKEAAPCF